MTTSKGPAPDDGTGPSTRRDHHDLGHQSTAGHRQNRAVAGPLRRVLDTAVAESGLSMDDYTVLDKKNDPYRVDTPAGHRDGQWFKAQIADLGLSDEEIHLRGLHYQLLPDDGDDDDHEPGHRG
jgi:hypothetical protein